MSRKRKDEPPAEPAAGNGILSRRIFLERALIAGAAGVGAGATGALAEPLAVPRWSQEPGGDFTAYGMPSHYERQGGADLGDAQQSGDAGHRQLAHAAPPARRHDHAERAALRAQPFGRAGHRSGRSIVCVIHGLVKQPLVFSLEDLSRYPRTSRIAFLECAGNSGALSNAQAAPLNVQAIHGLLSCSDWTGVQALDAARRSRHRSARQVGAGRRRRLVRHEPQLPARQGDG